MSLPNYTNPPDPNSPSRSNGTAFVKAKSPISSGIKGVLVALSVCSLLFVIWISLHVFGPSYVPPDLAAYVHLRTLDDTILNLENPNRRIIMVGDLHGMIHSLDNLLVKIEYNPHNDLLIHLGDITSKGPHSNELLSRFASYNTTGVRGNNDQKVIEWYGWFAWVKSHHEGARWLHALLGEKISPKEARRAGLWKSLKYKYPQEWDWGGDHFTIATKMSEMDYKYLISLPIVLHLTSLHTFMVHAGILPIDPQHHMHGHNQPLAHLPKQPKLRPDGKNIEAVRTAQELALLTDIPGNTDPFIKLNMRDVHDGVPIRKGPSKHDDNIPWSELWNDVVEHCLGFGVPPARYEGILASPKPLPCFPITVVYSHASSRGLDLKRWSKGLDTGCVNGDGLTAMILNGGPLTVKREDPDNRDTMVEFGENRTARLVTVACPIPPTID